MAKCIYQPPAKMAIPAGLTQVDCDAIRVARQPYKTPKSIPKSIAESWNYIGGLSDPSKMPCKSFAIPAKTCPMGRHMVGQFGTVCSGCYVLKSSNYNRFNVKTAQWRRYLRLNRPQWVDHMVECVDHYSNRWFRFHDSGDIVGEWHLDRITKVAEKLPRVKFWIPTREYKTVRNWIAANGKFPQNLTVRMSAIWVDQPASFAGGLPVSTVYTDQPIGRPCVAYSQNGECRDCRLCWNKRIRSVSYPRH